MKKGPEIKAPKFLVDLYGDLRDQRLLPIVIALLIAIPVVPFLLRDPTPAFVPPDDGAGLVTNGSLNGDSLMVVSSQPGLRDHKERFEGRKARNPFKSPGASTAAPASSEGGAATTTEVTETTEVTDTGSGETTVEETFESGPVKGGGKDAGKGQGKDSGKGAGETNITYYRLRTDVRFGKAGTGVMSRYDDLMRLAGLPTYKPVVIFVGASADGKRAVFSVSSDISKVTGKGQCSTLRPTDCQYLTLRTGRAVNLHDARRGVVWRLALSSIDVVETDVETLGGSKGSGPEKEKGSGSQDKDSDSVVAQPASLS